MRDEMRAWRPLDLAGVIRVERMIRVGESIHFFHISVAVLGKYTIFKVATLADTNEVRIFAGGIHQLS